MARAGAVYPQVELGAAALAQARVGRGAARASAAGALARCRCSGARALALGARRLVREAELERAVDWGLGALPAARLAWSALPVVAASASEIDVRRRFMAGAPMVLVADGRRIVGVIERGLAGIGGPAPSLAGRLEHPASRDEDARLWLLRAAGKLGEGLGTPAFAVGGCVRDLLLGRAAPDVDVVVEGDGIAFARRLSEEIGGRMSVHAAFGTAAIEGGSAGGGSPLPRVDVTSARRERYERPGALPIVSPAGLAEDLERRDFSINAMAMSLAPSAFGRLVDPCAGRLDLARGLLRPLHPLSFVEDPTRIFRAARYGARLGFRLAPAGRSALWLALRAGPYGALSGQRLRAELDLLAAEPRAALAFDRILRWGALKIWNPELRHDAEIMRRLRVTGRVCALLGAAGLTLEGGSAALIAVLIGQRPRVVGAALDRLAVTGAPRRALLAASAGTLVDGLERAARPSAVAALLDRRPAVVVAGAWLGGLSSVRRRIEWYLSEGRAVRPGLSGADLIDLGVPRGPAVGAGLAMLQRLRLDGKAASLAEERLAVDRWLATRQRATDPARQGGLR